MTAKWVIGGATLLSVAAVAVQQYSLSHYGLTLPLPEWLWVQLIVGWAFTGAGLAASRMRPETAVGAWMVALGLVWIGRLVFVAPLIQWETIGTGIAFYGLLFVLLFSLPSGHLQGWRRALAIGYLTLVAAIATIEVALRDHSRWVDDDRCCPPHLLLIDHNPALADRILGVASVGLGLVVIALVVVSVNKWRRATSVERRAWGTLGIVLVPVTVVLVLVPLANAYRLGFGALGVPGVVGRTDLWVMSGALTLLPLVILAQLLWVRLSRARVADLVRYLGDAVTPERLEQLLRETLGDEAAQLVFATSRPGEYVRVDGSPAQLSDTNRMFTRFGDTAGLLHDPAVDPDLVTAAGSSATLALANARLQAELKAQLATVRRSRQRIVAATDETRRRVERDLHDGAQQRLVLLSTMLKEARSTSQLSGDATDELLRRAAEEADVAIGELRDLARGVHPAILVQAGLEPAIAGITDRAPIPVTLHVAAGRFSTAVEAAAYFVITESLANVFKHSGASEASVRVRHDGTRLVVEIGDDGIGGADPGGSGLSGLRDRVLAIGGTLAIVSPRGGGTRVVATLPTGGPDEQDAR
jgi:signal transduction histidine kinase